MQLKSPSGCANEVWLCSARGLQKESSQEAVVVELHEFITTYEPVEALEREFKASRNMAKRHNNAK